MMTKRRLFLAAILQATTSSHVAATAAATSCEGDSTNMCNGSANACTPTGLCVVHAGTGNCCVLTKPYGFNGCISDRNGAICDDDDGTTGGVTNLEEGASADDANGIVAVVDVATVVATPPPTPRPTKPPTPNPTPGPTAKPLTDSPTTSSPPTGKCHNVEVGLIFDEYPGETRWEITKGKRNSITNDNAEVLKRSPYYDPDDGYSEASETHVVCLPPGRYTFTIMDRNRDGMCCNNGEGRYALTDRDSGEIITHGGKFEQYESVIFSLPYYPPAFVDADGDGIEDRTKNVIPPMILTEDGFPPAKCENEFGLHIDTDDYGVETTWDLRERSATGKYEDGKVVVSGGPYSSDHSYDLSYCLYPGKYTFVFYDWQCDGLTGRESTGKYVIKVNDKAVHTGGTVMTEYWEEVKLEFKKGVGESVEAVSHSSGSMERGSVTFAAVAILTLGATLY